jgi:hypothetical protein
VTAVSTDTMVAMHSLSIAILAVALLVHMIRFHR